MPNVEQRLRRREGTGYKPIPPTAMGLGVIAGRGHGRRLDVPRGGHTGPPSGLGRGALVDMLERQGRRADVRILDLLAGSGALGIDARRRHGETVLTLLARSEDAS